MMERRPPIGSAERSIKFRRKCRKRNQRIQHRFFELGKHDPTSWKRYSTLFMKLMQHCEFRLTRGQETFQVIVPQQRRFNPEHKIEMVTREAAVLQNAGRHTVYEIRVGSEVAVIHKDE